MGPYPNVGNSGGHIYASLGGRLRLPPLPHPRYQRLALRWIIWEVSMVPHVMGPSPWYEVSGCPRSECQAGQ